MKHLKTMPKGCKSIKVYADTKDEYYTFIHHEAVEALEQYFEFRRKQGEIITPDSWVFPRGYASTMPLRSCDVSVRFSHSFRNRIDLGSFRGNRHDVETVHGLRKRWNTILKSNPDINSNHAEKIFGHSTTHTLDNTYHKPLLEQLFDEYQKAIPDLIIDEKYRLQEEIENKNKKLHELESNKDRRIYNLESKIEQITALLENISH